MKKTEEATGFNAGNGLSKLDQYGWGVLDERGHFEWIPKDELFIDHAYQRDKVSQIRVASIRRDWSWVACGVLIVARRKDGSLWIVDGQHRKLAADHRVDIQDLPCIVFNAAEVKDEATGFYRANTVRGPVDSYSKFKAMVEAGDPVAKAVKQMVESTGYKATVTHQTYGVACVVRLMNCYSSDAPLTMDVWKLLCEIGDGEPPTERVVAGVFLLESRLREEGMTLLDKRNKEVLQKAGLAGIQESIQKTLSYYSKGGERYYAEGILQLLNKRRSSHRIPSLINS